MTAPFIMKHLNLGFGPGSRLIFGADGQVHAEFNWQVQYDVCPTWLRLALDHLAESNRQRELRVIAWHGVNDDEKAKTLHAEFRASLQAIVCAATAVDATYASVNRLISVPLSVRQAWQKNRTPRFAQVHEVLRRAFCIGNNHAKGMYAGLREIYRLRDSAVHPAAEMKPLVLHPELKVPVEWQFDLYRAQNAATVVAGVGQLLWSLSHNRKPRHQSVVNFASNMRLYLSELYPGGVQQLPQ